MSPKLLIGVVRRNQRAEHRRDNHDCHDQQPDDCDTIVPEAVDQPPAWTMAGPGSHGQNGLGR